MKKRFDELDKLKQLTEFMKDHNIRKLKTPEFQIEMGRPEDAINQEIDAELKEKARKLAPEIFFALQNQDVRQAKKAVN